MEPEPYNSIDLMYKWKEKKKIYIYIYIYIMDDICVTFFF